MTRDELSDVLKKTGGRCHLCKKGRFSVKSYGTKWELDHSNPKARGGSDRRSNLLPAHVACNRSKQDRSTRSVRNENGFSKRPLSKDEQQAARAKNTVAAAGLGAVLGGIVGGPPGAWLGGAVGGFLGHNTDVE